MKDITAFFFFFFCFFLLCSPLQESRAIQTQTNDVYIVYMGAATTIMGSLREDHTQLHKSLIKSQNAVIHSYRKGFSGFAVRLSSEEAESIAQRPGVVSVFRDPVYQLHTTRSWEFLRSQAGIDISSSRSSRDQQTFGSDSDTIIGIFDTGIWPEAESFNDKNMGPIPSKWKGTCMKGKDFNSSHCNRKLIGARYYKVSDGEKDSSRTPRDLNGHGTHVASTLAGRAVAGASYYGLAKGTAVGGVPFSRIASYNVCPLGRCFGSALLAAFDDAIADGVDLISVSIGSAALMDIEFWRDPLSIGSFHAVEKGISVVCSAGNDGPLGNTVVNVAPWMLTVGATTIDRDFPTDVILGDNEVIKGGALNFGIINKSSTYPLISGGAAWASSRGLVQIEARNCNTASLDPDKVKGRILLCEDTDDEYENRSRMEEVRNLGGVGLIIIDRDERQAPVMYSDFPISAVNMKDGLQIFFYLNSTRNPVATILPTTSVINHKPAPEVAYFSSRGPNFSTRNLLKPDVIAPGVNILAAWRSNDSTEAVPGKEPPLFDLVSGTSMACPHVSALAAIIKSRNPTWSPSAIKSAIMTTATQTNNMKAPIATNSGELATPYDIGAGQMSLLGSLQPGLVYETQTADYLQFFCNLGYNISMIKHISTSIPHGFACPLDSNDDSISNMNYPSISISKFSGSRKVIRTVTNVGEDESIYTATVEARKGIEVTVTPDKLQFTKKIKKISYEVSFIDRTLSSTDEVFGSITWASGKYKVRIPMVVSYY